MCIWSAVGRLMIQSVQQSTQAPICLELSSNWCSMLDHDRCYPALQQWTARSEVLVDRRLHHCEIFRSLMSLATPQSEEHGNMTHTHPQAVHLLDDGLTSSSRMDVKTNVDWQWRFTNPWRESWILLLCWATVLNDTNWAKLMHGWWWSLSVLMSVLMHNHGE